MAWDRHVVTASVYLAHDTRERQQYEQCTLLAVSAVTNSHGREAAEQYVSRLLVAAGFIVASISSHTID